MKSRGFEVVYIILHREGKKDVPPLFVSYNEKELSPRKVLNKGPSCQVLWGPILQKDYGLCVHEGDMSSSFSTHVHLVQGASRYNTWFVAHCTRAFVPRAATAKARGTSTNLSNKMKKFSGGDKLRQKQVNEVKDLHTSTTRRPSSPRARSRWTPWERSSRSRRSTRRRHRCRRCRPRPSQVYRSSSS